MGIGAISQATGIAQSAFDEVSAMKVANAELQKIQAITGAV